MAFWSGAKLRDECQKQKIIDGFNADRIDCSAYELSMGAEAYVTPVYGQNPNEKLKKLLRAPLEVPVFGELSKARGETFVIPPGQFAFLLTEEVVKIPKNAMGFISLKTKIKFKGLINVSGFHVDPGFSGNLIYAVFNAAPSEIHIARGERLFQLWLADLDGPVVDKFVKASRAPQLDIPTSLVSEVSRESHTLMSLSHRIDELADSVNTIVSVARGILSAVGIALAIAGVWIAWEQLSEPDDSSKLPKNQIEQAVEQIGKPGAHLERQGTGNAE